VKNLVIYHFPCFDGFTAAWVARRALGEKHTLFWPTQYGQEPPWDQIHDTEKVIYILDFSYPREVMEKLLAIGPSYLVCCLDHHKTAEEALRDLPECEFDMNRSGAQMAWDYFFPGEPRPDLVDYVADRDLWRWELPYSRAINARIRLEPYEFRAFDRLATMSVVGLQGEGALLLRNAERYVEEVSSLAYEARLDGFKVPFINAPFWNISEMLQHLCIGRSFAVGWWRRSDGKYSFSLRSDADGYDVSAIAKEFGGGGHEHSAGFVLDALPEELR
jgi:oligoribonuclease NrnB/cAMP/cGMP phosphodiesterase (DHH superfamily)